MKPTTLESPGKVHYRGNWLSSLTSNSTGLEASTRSWCWILRFVSTLSATVQNSFFSSEHLCVNSFFLNLTLFCFERQVLSDLYLYKRTEYIYLLAGCENLNTQFFYLMYSEFQSNNLVTFKSFEQFCTVLHCFSFWIDNTLLFRITPSYAHWCRCEFRLGKNLFWVLALSLFFCFIVSLAIIYNCW